MSMHKKPLTDLERKGLEVHGLDIGTPSQLSDVFRQGVAWALEQASRTGGEVAARVYHGQCEASGEVWAQLNSIGRQLPAGTELYTHPIPAAAVPDGWLELYEEIYNTVFTIPQSAVPVQAKVHLAHEAMKQLRNFRALLTAAPQPVGESESRDLAMAIRMLVSRIGKLEGRDSDQYKKWSKYIAENGLHNPLRAQPPEGERKE